ncbi:MAG TPA: hypothetical protein VIQ55_11440 [Burkholderiales bacterium]
MLSFFGLAYSLFPYVAIDRLTIWEAAAHPSALFILVGTLAVLPFLLGSHSGATAFFAAKRA